MDNTSSGASLPKVGDKGCYTVGSDTYPVTVTAVTKSGSCLTAVRARHRIVSGSEQDGSAEYEFEEDPNGERCRFTLRKNGRYRHVGWSSTGLLSLDGWVMYKDPSR